MRFPEFSGEWENKRIDEIAPLQRGFDLPTQDVEDGDYPVVYSNGILKYHKTYKCEAPGLVTGRSGSIGSFTYISDGKYWPHNTSLWVTDFKNNFPPFIYYLYQTINISQYASGSSVPTLNRNDVHRHITYLPTFIEQVKIAKLLLKIDERIDTQRKIIEDLKKLKDAIRTKLFTSLESHCNEYDEIRNMLHYEQPSAYLVNSTEYSEDYPTPVLTANKAFILGYTDEEQGVYDKGDCIIFDDFTMDLKYVTFPFKVKSSAIKILTPRQNIDLYFIYEYLLYLGLVSEEHKRHYISEIESMNIIHPQLKEQRQISQALRSLEMQVGNAIALQNLLVKQKQHFLSRMFI